MAKKSKKTKQIAKRPVAKNENVAVENVRKTKIRVIGIGGGGGAIVSEIASKMPKASFVAANTDLKALKSIGKKISLFQFGQNFTHGLGTGMSAEIGREAALADKERITKLLEGQDLCVLIASLGGGTGSGALPVFAKISQSLGNLTYGIFTLPLKFEGERKMEIAKDALKRVKNYLNVMSLIPNERVFQMIDKATPLKEALSIINQQLARSLGGLIETIYEPGLINIDFADLKTILEGSGKLAYLNTVEVPRKEDSTKDLMEKVLNSSLYPYTIRGAKGILFNIAGEKNLSLAEVNQISKTISELANQEAKIIFGISQGSKYSDVIKTTVLATGCAMKGTSGGNGGPIKKAVKKIVKKKNPVPTKEEPKEEIQAKEKKSKRKPIQRKKKPVKEEVKIEVKEEASKEEVPVEMKKTRKNGLEIKKEVEEMEKEILEREKVWETPAFLRKNIPIN